MRISDWSSDVCSSDLVRQFPHRDHDMWPCAKGEQEFLVNVIWPLTPFTADNGATHIYPNSHGAAGMAKADLGAPVVAACAPGWRSEERRVGTECVRTGRSRWLPSL